MCLVFFYKQISSKITRALKSIYLNLFFKFYLKFRHSMRPQNLNVYKQKVQNMKQVINKTKENAWRKLCTKLNNINVSKTWEIVNTFTAEILTIRVVRC